MLECRLRLEQRHAGPSTSTVPLTQDECWALEEMQTRGGRFLAQMARLCALRVAEADVVCRKVAVA